MAGGVAHLGVRLGRAEPVEGRSARSDHELTDALCVGSPRRVLQPETLVLMVVAGEEEVSASGIEVVDQRPSRGVARVHCAAGPSRRVPVGGDAWLGRRGEIPLQPLLLG